MTMGQTSSQVRPTETGTPGVDQSALMKTSNGGNNKRTKSRRKHKGVAKGPVSEQESARALLQLREKLPLDEDEIAASTTFSAVNVNGKDNIEARGRNKAHQVTDKSGKRKRQRHEFRDHKGNFTVRDRDDERSKRAKLNNSVSLVKSQTSLPPPSLSTNDVTMDESGASPKTQNVVKPKPIMQQLLAETDNEQFDAPIQSSDRLPSLVVKTPQRQNHLKERKHQSQSRVESSDAATQEQPNHPGQLYFDFAYATFNDDFSQLDMKTANLFNSSNHRIFSSRQSCLDQ